MTFKNFWIRLINLLLFKYLTGKTVQCGAVYFPSITDLGLYQAHCRARSADSTAGSGSHGETGKRCQESSRFDEDHGGGRCFETVRRYSSISRPTASQHLANIWTTADRQTSNCQPTVDRQTTDKVVWELFFTFINIRIQVIHPTSLEESLQTFN